MIITLLYSDGCPNWQITDEHLRRIADESDDLRIERVRITTDAEAIAARFHGSPTVLLDGFDPFAKQGDPYGLSCRLYRTPNGPAGSPTLDQLRAALAVIPR